jgi:poly(3-hydroxybutyrate) depolymerase
MMPTTLVPKSFLAAAIALSLTAVLPASAARAQIPEGSPTDLPVLSSETARGTGELVTEDGPSPAAKTIDGSIADWVGRASRFGGTSVVSAGEYVYQDHLFDAYGPDDGRDAARFAQTDALEELRPEFYRIDALSQADAAGELGIPTPEQFSYNATYGDAVDHQDAADLYELRLDAAGDRLSLLARTTTMKSSSDTALLLLADTVPDSPAYEVPFNSGLTTTSADVAAFIADGRVLLADLAAGTVGSPQGGTAVANPSEWTNALEASVPLASLTNADGDLVLAAASGKPNDARDGFAPLAIETNNETAHANVANVAFRFSEPVRYWFEKTQALSLHAGTIDRFFTTVAVSDLTGALSQRYVPGPGYHDRIFVSPPDTGVPNESGRNGIVQHYGVFLPSAYDGSPAPLQWWLHWRGGDAHSGAAVVPKVFKQFGEDRDTIVVAPSGRGTSTWYVGRGHLDFRQVWSDVFETFNIDRSRVYSSGHSMGGWGSYLLTLLYPDRFAAAAPAAGPVTQGAWTGADFEGCDDMEFDGNTPCYISANDSRPRDQHTRKLLENARHVPYAILHGTDDELVPYSGVVRQAQRLVELNYRHRLYTYPGYEHYTHPAVDQWAEAASYLHSFTRPENPAHVTYKRDMLFERATEEVQSGGVALNFDFDSAYWVSGLTPADMAGGTASFDGRSLAISEAPHVAVPDTGPPTAPGQTGPYVITGMQWLDNPTASEPEASNGFDIDLLGTSAVTLDAARMALDTTKTIVGTVSTEAPLDLGLTGEWRGEPEVLVDGEPVEARLQQGTLRVPVPSGDHEVRVVPPQPTAVSFTSSSAGEGQYSDDATVEALLVDASGGPLASRTLTFTLGGGSVSATTNEAGVATADLPVDAKPGARTVRVSFSGTAGRLLGSSATDEFLVHQEDTALGLTYTKPGPAMSLVATLADLDSSEGVSGRVITFFARGERLGTSTTNADGVASFPLKRAKDRREGITYEATFAGDDFYLGSTRTARRT